MKTKDIIRKVFQTFTVILFLIQFQQSVRKYFQYPVVEQKLLVAVKDLPNPLVYVCHASQFNYSKALLYGYEVFTNFMAGINMNNTNISWRGKWGNSTFKGLKNILLDSDYSSLESKTLLSSTDLWNNNEMKKNFLFPHGVCMELENLQQFTAILIYSSVDINAYFVDPARANNIRTEESPDAKANIGPTSSNYFSSGIYSLDYRLYDDSIHDGTNCADYTKLDLSYRECLNNVLAKEFMPTYGCLPPWVSTSHTEIICQEETNIDANTIKKTPLFNNILHLIQNFEADMFKSCLRPCKTMQIKLKQVSSRSNKLVQAKLKVRVKEWATVHTQVYSYDILSLTVDLGSALGLWLGLSCLSILDHILENWISMKKYCTK